MHTQQKTVATLTSSKSAGRAGVASVKPLAEAPDPEELALYRNINSGAGSGELKFKDIGDFEQLRGHHEHDEEQSEHDEEGHQTANQEAVKLLNQMIQAQIKETALEDEQLKAPKREFKQSDKADKKDKWKGADQEHLDIIAPDITEVQKGKNQAFQNLLKSFKRKSHKTLEKVDTEGEARSRIEKKGQEQLEEMFEMREVKVSERLGAAPNEDGAASRKEVVCRSLPQQRKDEHGNYGRGLTDIKECKMEHDHKTQRVLETLKLGKPKKKKDDEDGGKSQAQYYVLVKQFIHDVDSEESMLNLQIVRYRSGEDPAELASIGVGQLGDGGRPGKLDSCYHPALISTIQNGRYLYFFRCGSDQGKIRKDRIKSEKEEKDKQKQAQQEQEEKDAKAKVEADPSTVNEGGEIEIPSDSGNDTQLEGGDSADGTNSDGSDKSAEARSESEEEHDDDHEDEEDLLGLEDDSEQEQGKDKEALETERNIKGVDAANRKRQERNRLNEEVRKENEKLYQEAVEQKQREQEQEAAEDGATPAAADDLGESQQHLLPADASRNDGQLSDANDTKKNGNEQTLDGLVLPPIVSKLNQVSVHQVEQSLEEIQADAKKREALLAAAVIKAQLKKNNEEQNVEIIKAKIETQKRKEYELKLKTEAAIDRQVEFNEKILSREDNLKDIEVQNKKLTAKEEKVRAIEEKLTEEYKEQKIMRRRQVQQEEQINEYLNNKRLEELLKEKARKREQERKNIKAKIADIQDGEEHDLIELCRIDLEALEPLSTEGKQQGQKPGKDAEAWFKQNVDIVKAYKLHKIKTKQQQNNTSSSKAKANSSQKQQQHEWKQEPLAVIFNKKLEQKELYEHTQDSEPQLTKKQRRAKYEADGEVGLTGKESEFINKQMISIVYKHEKTDMGMISVRQIENIHQELHQQPKVALQKPIYFVNIQKTHPKITSSEDLMLLSCSTKKEQSDNSYMLAKRSFKVWSIEYFEKDVVLKDLDYPKGPKIKNEVIFDENIRNNAQYLYQNLQEQQNTNESSHYTFQVDQYKHKYSFELKQERIVQNFTKILETLNISSNIEKQTINTVIDHIEKKCLIIINNWFDGKEIKIIEGNLPSKRLRIESIKQTGPLNQYIMKIFDEYGYFKSCLMINSTFKNIIRDVDNIHIFYNKQTQQQQNEISQGKNQNGVKKDGQGKEKKTVDHKADGRSKAEHALTRQHTHKTAEPNNKQEKQIAQLTMQDVYKHEQKECDGDKVLYEGLSSMHKLDGIFIQISREQYDLMKLSEKKHQGGFDKQKCDGSVKFISIDGNSHFKNQFFRDQDNEFDFFIVQNDERTTEDNNNNNNKFDLKIVRDDKAEDDKSCHKYREDNNIKLVSEILQFNQDNRNQRPFVALKLREGTSLIDKVYFILVDIINVSIIDVKEIDLKQSEKKLLKPHDFKISTSISIEQVPMANPNLNRHTQSYQVCICYEQQFRFQMFEFQVSWTRDIKDNNNKDCNHISVGVDLVAKKELIRQINDQLAVIEHFEFLPLFHGSGNLGIVGTQLLINYGSLKANKAKQKNIKIISMMNLADGDFLRDKREKRTYLQALTKVAFKRYTKQNTSKYENVLVEARINTDLSKQRTNLLSDYDRNQILQQQIHSLLNMVPQDFTNFIERDQSNNYDFFQNLESLDGQSLCHYYANETQRILKEFKEERNSKGRQCRAYMSLLQQTLENDPDDQRVKFFEKIELLRQPNQLCYDFDFETAIDKCFKSDGNPMIPSLDIIFSHILNCKTNSFYQNMMMRKMKKMVINQDFEDVCKPFFKFFNEKSYEDGLVNFESQIIGYTLPKYSEQELQIKRISFENEISQNIGERVSQSIRETIKGNKFPVKHSYIDWRQTMLQEKLFQIDSTSGIDGSMEIDKKLWVEMNEYFIADLFREIQKKVQKGMESQRIIMNVVDSMFQKTQRYQQKLLVMYTCFFFFPFLIQSFMPGRDWEVQLCHGLCMFSSICCFFPIEVVMIHDDGWNYFKTITKLLDISSYIFYWIYFCLRIGIAGYQLPLNNDAYSLFKEPHETEEVKEDASLRQHNVYSYMVFLNVMVLLCSFFKVQLYLRVFENFGMLLELLSKTVDEIRLFAGFFYTWIFMFSLIFQILGMQIPNQESKDSDYKELNIFVAYFFYTYRNSIGDINAPVTSFWTTRATHMPDSATETSLIMFVIWTFWLLNQFFVLIVLLNFLIAIISESYEAVMAESIIHKYEHKIEMNRSHRLVAKSFGMKSLECQIVTASPKEENVEDWTGFVHTITKFIQAKTDQNHVNQALQLKKTELLVDGTIKKTSEELRKFVDRSVGGVEERMKKLADDMREQNIILQQLAKQ